MKRKKLEGDSCTLPCKVYIDEYQAEIHTECLAPRSVPPRLSNELCLCRKI